MGKYFLLLSLLFWSCNPNTTPDETANPNNKMKLLWEIPYDFVGIGITTTPMILGDSLVIMSAGKEIYAVEQSTGRIRWKYFVQNETDLQSDEFRTDGKRIFMTHVEDIRAINISDGSLAWLTSLPEERGAFWNNEISYFEERLFVGGYLNAYCLDAISGDILWAKKLLPNGQLLDAITTQNYVYFSGAYWIVDSLGHALNGSIAPIYCLNKINGDTVWCSYLKGNGGVRMSSVVANNTIFAGTTFESPSSFESLDATTGQRKWSYYQSDEDWDYNDCIVVDNKIIANAGPYHVCAFDKNSGELLWRTFIANDAESRKLHYYNGYVYHTQGWKLFVLNPENGQIVYSLKPQGRDLVTIAVGNGKVFVCGHPTLQCYETYKPE